MKNFYYLLLTVLCTTFCVAQNNNFNNAGGDLLWSNSANWSLNATPTAANTVRLPLLVESLVDADYTVTKLQTVFSTSNASPGSTVALAGSSNLTINPGTNTGIAIDNVSGHNALLSFKGNIIINNPGNNSWMRNQNGASNKIEFASGSLLTLNSNLESRKGSGSGDYTFGGSLAGSGILRFGPNTDHTFTSTSNNPSYTGQIVWVGANVDVVVDTANNSTFLPSSSKVQVNATNGSLTVNGANVYKGSVSVNAAQSFIFNLNANQNSMEFIQFTGSKEGTLNVNINSSVTSLVFNNNAAEDWGTATINITGYQEGVLRFGTDNTGLTAGQLSQISADNGGEAVALDTNGFLVNASSLSTNDLLLNNKFSVFPTQVEHTLFFNTPQNDVKVFDLKGRLMFQNVSQNQEEISVNALSSGMYIAVFENKIIKKFIKK